MKNHTHTYTSSVESVGKKWCDRVGQLVLAGSSIRLESEQASERVCLNSEEEESVDFEV